MATSITVTGLLKTNPATAATGYVRFEPTATMYDAAGNVLVTRSGVEAELTAGAFSLALYANDDPTTSPEGTAYKVYHTPVGRQPRLIGTHVIPYTSPGGTVNLADLSPAEVEVNVSYATTAQLNAHEHGVPMFAKSGLYYAPGNSMGTGTPTLNTLYAVPYLIGRATTINQLAIDVTGNVADAVARLGVYEDTGVGYPGDLLVQTSALDASATGLVSEAVSTTLPAGIVWLGYVGQTTAEPPGSAPPIRIFSATGVQFPIGVATPSTAMQIAYIEAGVTGALTDPFTSTVTTLGGNMPRVYFRVA